MNGNIKLTFSTRNLFGKMSKVSTGFYAFKDHIFKPFKFNVKEAELNPSSNFNKTDIPSKDSKTVSPMLLTTTLITEKMSTVELY